MGAGRMPAPGVEGAPWRGVIDTRDGGDAGRSRAQLRPMVASRVRNRVGSTGLTRWWSKPASWVCGGRSPGRSRSGRRAGAGRSRLACGAGGRPRSRPCRAGRCRAARRSGVERRGRVAGPTGRRGRRATSWPAAPQEAGQALGRVARCRRPPGRGGGGRPWRRLAPAGRSTRRRPGAVGQGSGRRTTNSLPWPGPSLWAVDACRRASRPGVCTRVRPMPRPPCERSSERSAWVNRSKTRGSISGGDADAVVAHPERRPRRRPRSARQRRSGRPRSVYLAALFSRFAEHLRQPRRVGLQRRRLGRAARRVSSWSRPSISGRTRLDGAGDDRGRGRPAPCGARSCRG